MFCLPHGQRWKTRNLLHFLSKINDSQGFRCISLVKSIIPKESHPTNLIHKEYSSKTWTPFRFLPGIRNFSGSWWRNHGNHRKSLEILMFCLPPGQPWKARNLLHFLSKINDSQGFRCVSLVKSLVPKELHPTNLIHKEKSSKTWIPFRFLCGIRNFSGS